MPVPVATKFRLVVSDLQAGAARVNAYDVRVHGGKDSEVGGGERVAGGVRLARQLFVDSLFAA